MAKGDLSIQIFNTEGKLCYFEKISDTPSYQINLNNFIPGLYQLVLRNGNSLSVSRKFVKE
ncbi:MAG: T9SS type A sorting domain-containing protein [Bacteroidetes bacterium]|nr:T9SS type A sorting domain-containing protein [Bacteroidota bacterium]